MGSDDYLCNFSLPLMGKCLQMQNEFVSIFFILIFIISLVGFFCLNMAQWSILLNSVGQSHVYKIKKNQYGVLDISRPVHKFLQYHYVASLYLNSLVGQLVKLHFLGHSRHNIIQRSFISCLQISKIMWQVCFENTQKPAEWLKAEIAVLNFLLLSVPKHDGMSSAEIHL